MNVKSTLSKEQPKILVVEDDPASVALVRRLLAGQGYQIVDVADGLESAGKLG